MYFADAGSHQFTTSQRWAVVPCQAVLAALPYLQVGILVNNAGLGPIDGVPEYLEEQPPQFIVDLVTINCLMPTMVGFVHYVAA